MKMMSMAQIMKKTSVVVLEDLPSSPRTCRAPAPPPREVRVRIRLSTASVAKAEAATRGGKPPVCQDERLPMPPPLPTKRRREVDDDTASRASKKKPVSDPAALVSVNTTRPTAQASRTKEEALVRCAAPRSFKNCKDGECRSQESLPMSNPRVPSPAPSRLDALSAQDALSAAIARARSVLDKRREVSLRREEARRELDKMVRTVEFNDPYISPMDALKP
ncbi:hypothetical protein E2562_025089 [Oryza meyeriana var. granulata]|uniref:Uncharacterized protein n=1 Tax=Oryza meyeriana var. granulata TaxID=110450 RepID=A0A6G1D7R5_9ORYZ|nr:hypothetical protein E2562_025089 [Oryza meyeriana var. granulata]